MNVKIEKNSTTLNHLKKLVVQDENHSLLKSCSTEIFTKSQKNVYLSLKVVWKMCVYSQKVVPKMCICLDSFSVALNIILYTFARLFIQK